MSLVVGKEFLSVCEVISQSKRNSFGPVFRTSEKYVATPTNFALASNLIFRRMFWFAFAELTGNSSQNWIEKTLLDILVFHFLEKLKQARLL